MCGSSDGSSLTISGTRQTTTNNSPSTPRSGTPPQDNTSSPPAGPSPEAIRLAECLDDGGTTRCVRREAPEPEPNDPPQPGVPAVTISDLVQFTPEATVLAAEPGNVGVAGMPTNFAAAASVQTRTGSLFGVPVVVRFTPVGYDYTFGDGESATTTTAGQTWEALGQAPFTPTPTSHTYRQRGTYPARVDTRYTAEIDLGTGWIPVSGQLTSRGLTVAIRIFEARTALVAHTCDEDPDGSGC
ncbi:hypothetical protein A4X16_15965 [Microbacterium sp. H83]|nr:hypothetical protein A4X16_15965 [Microbacterium sp. H83]